MTGTTFRPRRRDLFKLIGAVGGAAALHPAMTALGAQAESDFNHRAGLEGRVRKTSVVILGAGLAGLVAAVELTKLGYKVELLEYNQRVGGRSWTLRGGDVFTELGGATQTCQFDPGHYFNAGPMRIAYAHHGFIDYCRQFKVPLEPFLQQNGNAYVHSSTAFDGKPQRFHQVQNDFTGYVAELLAKASGQQALDAHVTTEDLEILREALRSWGALDRNNRYTASAAVSAHRGYRVPRGGGLSPTPDPSMPIELTDLLKSRVWRYLTVQEHFEWTPTMLQPVGGMDRLALAMGKSVEHLIRFQAKVTAIQQDDHGVTVTYVDGRASGAVRQARADWCICTIPGSILGQIPLNVGPALRAAIADLYYAATVKVALQFKRRFWEEDEAIYGGITFTDLPINEIVYPSSGLGSTAKGVVVSGYVIALPDFDPVASFTQSAASPQERIEWSLREGARIHPQFPKEFESGFSVAWHRVPSSLGCFAMRHAGPSEQHYRDLCAIDGRLMLAGEHASRLPGWQEGSILSSLDAIERLHPRALAREASV